MDEAGPLSLSLSNSIVVDHSSSFQTDQIFASRDDLLNYVRSVCRTLGMVTVINRSDNGARSGKIFCELVCEKAGKYKHANMIPTGSRKCCCKFRLKGKFIKKLGGWILSVMCGIHNHALQTYPQGHPNDNRLTIEQKEVVSRMTKNLIAPNRILAELRSTYPTDDHFNLKQIHNVRSRLRSSNRQGRTELQQWMTVPECAYLAANKYSATIVCWYRALPFSVYPFLIAPNRNAPVFHILFTGNHFVTPVMKTGSPMPGTITPWTKWRKQIAKDWPRKYTGPLQQYVALNPFAHAPKTVDLSKD